MADEPLSARRLLGKQVVVTLDKTDGAVARGLLLAIEDSGEFVVQDDNGFLRYCWPMLDIAEVQK